jgi:autotransporter family porin
MPDASSVAVGYVVAWISGGRRLAPSMRDSGRRWWQAIALTGTILLSAVLAPGQAMAAPCIKFPAHGPIFAPPPAGVSITCNNAASRSSLGTVIDIITSGLGNFINLTNSGRLVGGGTGIAVHTDNLFASVTLVNSGPIFSLGTGISATTLLSGISLTNSGDIAAAGLGTFGIFAATITGKLSLHNSGDINTAGLGTFGISAATGTGALVLQNSGDIATAGAGVFGISAATGLGKLSLNNSGKIASVGAGVFGISAFAGAGDISLQNSGNVAVLGAGAFGISALTLLGDLSLQNSGKIAAKGVGAFGISGQTQGGDLSLRNSGNILASGSNVFGISGNAGGGDLSVRNSGDITVTGSTPFGISGVTTSGDLSLENSGHVTVTGGQAIGLAASAIGGSGNDHITLVNQGEVTTSGVGIAAQNTTAGTTLINNKGSMFGNVAGIQAVSNSGITILNSGSISAGSLFAIGAAGGPVDIANSGLITGFVQINAPSKFDNQTGGVFEARLTSDFGLGSFHNEEGATVHTAADPNLAETTTFVGLREFRNDGLISLVDGHEGDVFEFANCNCQHLTFAAGGKSTVAVDAFLGGPGSKADNLIINGNVQGKTALEVHNTNLGGGAENTKGIPVVFVEGSINASQFFLKNGPIDAGLVAYDLFFVKTGSGFFELRTIPGGHEGSFLLPELTTASQDVFFATSESWFDRTADLRVLLNGGGPGEAESGTTYVGEGPNYDASSFTPAVWVRGSGNWLNQEDSAGATAYGRSYQFNLERDLQIMDFQSGIDFGKRDLLAAGDMLVFGLLGGAIHADLDYKNVARQFDYSGGEAGAYATYLNGGLFVDTLVKADFLELDPRDVRGFPNTLNDTNFGGRVDTGYRFGGFHGGMFLEPLATIAVAWSDIEGFSRDGNTVNFNDDANVRGRVGMRVGTSSEVWSGTTMEPFVIGSLWGTLSSDNRAMLTSLGTAYPTFTDAPSDAWGVVSTGVNFFNPGAKTSVFAKLDVSFGDDVTGLGAKAGMRYNW